MFRKIPVSWIKRLKIMINGKTMVFWGIKDPKVRQKGIFVKNKMKKAESEVQSSNNNNNLGFQGIDSAFS